MENMRKSIVLVVIVMVLCLGSLFACFAAYNYSSAPGAGVAWNFTADRQYTLNGECDIYYYKGSAGVLGIGYESSTARSSTKGITYWYGECLAAIMSSSGDFDVSSSGTPTTSGKEMHSGWASAENSDAPQLVQYEYSFCQVDGTSSINNRSYFYRSGWGLSEN